MRFAGREPLREEKIDERKRPQKIGEEDPYGQGGRNACFSLTSSPGD
jgi:hypothetical protein